MVDSSKPKVAIIHDWLNNQGGGERVVMALHEAFPDAPIYTSVFDPEKMPAFAGLDVRTSFMQRVPWARRKHQLFPWLRPNAFESFDLSEYDVVISSSSAESKGVITKPETLHICYCHTPTRYYWSDYARYRNDTGFGLLSPLVRLVMPSMIGRLRLWDFAAAQRVDLFIANSTTVQKRITKYYRRDSAVINPPVTVDRFEVVKGPKKGFITWGRLIPYKRVDLAVQACTELNLPLTVLGTGSELQRLRDLAGPTISFREQVSDEDIAVELGRSSAFIFSAEEDFGIVPLEAMAAGLPVIAFGKGGATETVVPGLTGMFFAEQTVDSLKGALHNFKPDDYDPLKIRAHAETFDDAEFIKKIKNFVKDNLKDVKKI